MQRLISIDIAKAICIILVVIGHYIPENSPNWYVTIHDVIYSFHMPLFIFISGWLFYFTCLRKDKPYKEIVKLKLERLGIPFLFLHL